MHEFKAHGAVSALVVAINMDGRQRDQSKANERVGGTEDGAVNDHRQSEGMKKQQPLRATRASAAAIGGVKGRIKAGNAVVVPLRSFIVDRVARCLDG